MKASHLTPEPCSKKARLLVADDHPMVREGLAQLINLQNDLVCCGTAGTVAATWSAIADTRPDLLLLDLRMGGGDNIEFIKSLIAQYPDLPILVVSQCDETLFAARALHAGAHGYIMKGQTTEELFTAIRTVLGGEIYVSRRMAGSILHRSLKPRNPEEEEGLGFLSDRELQVFQLIGSGLGMRQIAHELMISHKTVDAHRENIKRKFEFSCCTELVECATGWVQQNIIPKSPHPYYAKGKSERHKTKKATGRLLEYAG